MAITQDLDTTELISSSFLGQVEALFKEKPKKISCNYW